MGHAARARGDGGRLRDRRRGGLRGKLIEQTRANFERVKPGVFLRDGRLVPPCSWHVLLVDTTVAGPHYRMKHER